MICDWAEQVHIGDVDAAHSVVWVKGERATIKRTPCHLGGSRPWFLCPDCGRRCAILYPNVCRVCVGGRYLSEHKAPLDRLYQRAFAVRARLGQTEGGLMPPFPAKPKRMRWHTYLRIRKNALAREGQIYRALGASLPGGQVSSKRAMISKGVPALGNK